MLDVQDLPAGVEPEAVERALLALRRGEGS